MTIDCLSVLVILVSVLACGVRSAPLISDVNANITTRLFEGDIAGFDPSLLDGSEKTLSKIPDTYSKLWKNGIVYYTIKEKDYSSNQLKAILAGMKMIEDGTRVNGKDCIKFKKRKLEKNYLNIFSGDGCYSEVGQLVKPGPQEVSLQANGCAYPGTAAHEFLHALGFWHEQSRPDRDQFITIMWNNIEQDNRYNFDKYTTNIDSFGLPYDYESIMHYDAYAFAIDDTKPTIVSKKAGVTIKDNEKLSKLDIQAVQKLYRCI